MTHIMKLPNPTAGLWLGNLLGVLFLLAVVAYQLGGAIFNSSIHLPAIRPLAAQPVQPAEPLADAGNRNPFDASSARWKINTENTQGITGELRGVILLPGVQAVVTSSGTVHLGDALAEGRVTRIFEKKIVVDQGHSSKELELPSAKHPTLKSINKTGHGLDTSKGPK